MLEIWTANTPNGRKAAIMLEEIGWHDRLWQRPAIARGMDVPKSGPGR